MDPIVLDGESLDLESVHRISSCLDQMVQVHEKARARCQISRDAVEVIASGNRAVYGVNTGFGDLAKVRISSSKLAQLQENLIRSHTVGVGEPLPDSDVRTILLLRLNTLVKGYSGVSSALINQLMEMINRGVHPIVPRLGSLGASGDLAPLAHLSQVLIGEGYARVHGVCLPATQALAKVGLRPITLGPKEGLALINGTQVTTALACRALLEGMALIKAATIAGALSTEALRGTDSAFDPEIQQVRGHPGQIRIAEYLLQVMEGSSIRESHRDCDKVQDPYSIRCIPQVHGACLDTYDHAWTVVSRELNAATDNPLIFGNRILSGGNFHGEPVGFVMDFLTIALCELGSISERRVARLVDARLSGLPPFLTHDSGLNSGFMIPHYTAASLVMDNKVLAHPSTVDSLPTSADQEDHVSMSTSAARISLLVAENLSRILAVEFLTACQGLEFLLPLEPGRGAKAAYDRIRGMSAPVLVDRALSEEMETIATMLRSGSLIPRVEAACGHEPGGIDRW